MYKILINIVILLGALVLISSRAGAASLSLSPLPEPQAHDSLIDATSLGNLDGIAWEDLDQPRVEDVIAQLLVLPTAGEPWATDPFAEQDASTNFTSQAVSYSLPQPVQAYARFLYRQTYGGLDQSCRACQISPDPLSHDTNNGEKATQMQGNVQPVIDCARCHTPKPAQGSGQIRGVQ